MRPSLTVPTAVAAVVLLAGCGTGLFLGGGRECAPVATRVGVGLDVEPALATKVTRAEMEICWDGRCRSQQLELHDSTIAVPMGCEPETEAGKDGVCSATAEPTGGKHGFFDLQELPERPVRVSVVLEDADGRALLDDRIEVTPRPNPPQEGVCGDDRPQAGVIAGEARLRVRS